MQHVPLIVRIAVVLRDSGTDVHVLETLDLLRFSILENLEVLGRQAVDDAAVLQGIDIDGDEVRAGAEDRALRVGRFLLRRLCSEKSERSASSNNSGRDERPAHQSVHHVSSHGVGGSMITGRGGC